MMSLSLITDLSGPLALLVPSLGALPSTVSVWVTNILHAPSLPVDK